MKHLYKKLALIFVFPIISSFAQVRTGESEAKAVSLSAVDKNALIHFFESTNRSPNWFRLEFNNGRETYGNRKLSSTELEKIRINKANPGREGIVIRYGDGVSNASTILLKDGSIISSWCGCSEKNPLLHLLGKDKTATLQKIMAKYIEDPDILDNPDMGFTSCIPR